MGLTWTRKTVKISHVLATIFYASFQISKCNNLENISDNDEIWVAGRSEEVYLPIDGEDKYCNEWNRKQLLKQIEIYAYWCACGEPISSLWLYRYVTKTWQDTGNEQLPDTRIAAAILVYLK